MHQYAISNNPDIETLWALLRASRKVEQVLAQVLQAVELSPTQFDMLMQLENTPALTQAQLARTMLRSPGSAGILIRALENRGLVSRSPTHASSNRQPLQLTSEGQVMISSARRTLSSCSDLRRFGISTLDGELLSTALQSILTNE